MRYTQYRGLAQVTNWVKLKFAAMNLKKWPHGNGGICCPRFALLFFRSYMFETQSAHDYRLPICPIVYWTDRRVKFLDFSRLFLYNIKCKIVVFCLYLEKVLPLPQCHSVKRNLSFRGSDRCHCRGNPYSKRQRKRIAAPVCGLARNDKALN